jgi:hypothetical protein
VLPLLRAAKAHHLEDEITTTLDLIAPHEETLSMLKTVLPFVDFFMPSIEEAESISLLRGPLDCGTYFLSIGVRRACIFKAGVLGSYLTCRRDSPVDQQMAAAVAAAPTSSSFAATKQIMHIHTSGKICSLDEKRDSMSLVLQSIGFHLIDRAYHSGYCLLSNRRF